MDGESRKEGTKLRDRLPIWLRAIGWMVLPAGLYFPCRLIWEQTVWTWERGPQMVGFALAHNPSLFLAASVGSLLMLAWVVTVLGMTLWALVRRRAIPAIRWGVLALPVLLACLAAQPYGFWQRLFIGRITAGPYAAELMIHAAATGDLETVKAFLAHGVALDARDREGKTALHGAAVEGEVKVLEFLVAKGASVNPIDLWGNSPLENAVSMKRGEAAKFLSAHGGKLIRGDEAHQQEVARQLVREDMEKMERRSR